MKKSIVLFIVFAIMIMLFSFSFASFADEAGETPSVNAVEAAEETLPAAVEDDGNSELTTESTNEPALAVQAPQEKAEPIDIPQNPDTGIPMPVVHMLIALAVLIAMVVIKIINDKNKAKGKKGFPIIDKITGIFKKK